jgi:hypothetical protein
MAASGRSVCVKEWVRLLELLLGAFEVIASELLGASLRVWFNVDLRIP